MSQRQLPTSKRRKSSAIGCGGGRLLCGALRCVENDLAAAGAHARCPSQVLCVTSHAAADTKKDREGQPASLGESPWPRMQPLFCELARGEEINQFLYPHQLFKLSTYILTSGAPIEHRTTLFKDRSELLFYSRCLLFRWCGVREIGSQSHGGMPQQNKIFVPRHGERTDR